MSLRFITWWRITVIVMMILMMIRYRDSIEDLSPLFCSSSALGCAHGRDLERDALAILKGNHSDR